jgi:transcriptional regulator with XRE-family HTH domain
MMKDRIKLVMENENLTSAQFADRLQINRAVISHILNGRNNPSFDVIDKILRGMHINYDWLVYGEGEMYKQGAHRSGSAPKSVDLFSQNDVNVYKDTGKTEKAQETAVKQPSNNEKVFENKAIEAIKTVDRKVAQIIIYYSDNTFEVFRQ